MSHDKLASFANQLGFAPGSLTNPKTTEALENAYLFVTEASLAQQGKPLIRERAEEWLRSEDTGASSIALLKNTLRPYYPEHRGEQSHPVDFVDFGRCSRLLNQIPELRDRMTMLKAVDPIWGALVEHWAELERLYSTNKPEFRNSLLRIRDEAYSKNERQKIKYALAHHKDGKTNKYVRLQADLEAQLYIRAVALQATAGIQSHKLVTAPLVVSEGEEPTKYGARLSIGKQRIASATLALNPNTEDIELSLQHCQSNGALSEPVTVKFVGTNAHNDLFTDQLKRGFEGYQKLTTENVRQKRTFLSKTIDKLTFGKQVTK